MFSQSILKLFRKQASVSLQLSVCVCESAGTLRMMHWPPQSPDLNPSEQIWGELENKLDRSIVHSKEILWLELQKAWDNISVEVLRKYIDTMPERCAAVNAAKGGHTKY
uniref:Tc1-like transposase DDE domain-containing protein n=1 Tax=Sinocyclocheilus anshuiensis TaxID=1608454 RepID=A0A671T8F6_9TELE